MSDNTPIRAALERNRLSQTMVAEGIGVSRQAVWEWCSGRMTPSAENLVSLLEYLQQFEPGIVLRDLVPAEERREGAAA